MLGSAFVLLCAAALAGGVLATRFLRADSGGVPPRALATGHAALGVAALGVLLLALRRGLPHTGMGTAGFAPIAAGLLALALAFGLVLAHAAWRRRRPAGVVVAIHAGLAVSGLALLLALVALR